MSGFENYGHCAVTGKPASSCDCKHHRANSTPDDSADESACSFTDRPSAMKFLKESLTADQRAALKLVIQTAEVQGDYRWNGEDSVYEDDVAQTLNELAHEIGD